MSGKALAAGIGRATNRRLAPCRSQNSENVISFEQYWAKLHAIVLTIENPCDPKTELIFESTITRRLADPLKLPDLWCD